MESILEVNVSLNIYIRCAQSTPGYTQSTPGYTVDVHSMSLSAKGD